MRNLAELLFGIAEAIREKNGTQAEINAQNFPEEILKLSGGGEGEVVYKSIFYNSDNTIIFIDTNGTEHTMSCVYEDDAIVDISFNGKKIALTYEGEDIIKLDDTYIYLTKSNDVVGDVIAVFDGENTPVFEKIEGEKSSFLLDKPCYEAVVLESVNLEPNQFYAVIIDNKSVEYLYTVIEDEEVGGQTVIQGQFVLATFEGETDEGEHISAIVFASHDSALFGKHTIKIVKLTEGVSDRYCIRTSTGNDWVEIDIPDQELTDKYTFKVYNSTNELFYEYPISFNFKKRAENYYATWLDCSLGGYLTDKIGEKITFELIDSSGVVAMTFSQTVKKSEVGCYVESEGEYQKLTFPCFYIGNEHIPAVDL